MIKKITHPEDELIIYQTEIARTPQRKSPVLEGKVKQKNHQNK